MLATSCSQLYRGNLLYFLFFAQRKDIKLFSYSTRNPFQKEIWVPLYLLLDFRAHFCLFIFRKLVCSSLNDVRIVLCLTTDPL